MPDVHINREWLYFIADAEYKTCYIDNGVVKKDANPTPLPQDPEGWKNIQVEFGTNIKYFSLNRAFTIPVKLVNAAAQIIRYFAYQGKGYEEELYIIILRWNRETGIFELEYRGKIDMSKMEDDPSIGVTVNTVEGGLLSYLNANEGVTYEIACDETNPDIIQVEADGINLEDTYNYSITNQDVPFEFSITQPAIAFTGNDGDSVGTIHGDQGYDPLTGISTTPELQAYIQSGANYIFQSIYAIANATIKGTIKLNNTENTDYGIQLYLHSQYRRIDLLGSAGVFYDVTGSEEIAFEETIDIDPNEKFVFIYNIGFPTSGTITIQECSFYLKFNTRLATSLFYALRPLHAWKQLVSKISDGKYTGESAFFSAHNNIVVTCGDAIRNTSRDVVPNYKIATTLQDFFISYNAIYNLGLKVVNNVLYIEPKADLYNDDEEIFDLGEVADLRIGVPEEYLANIVNCGYPDQKYEERNGKYEFNSTQQYKLPVTSVNKAYDIISKYRGDGFGIEFIRSALQNKDTTDNDGDKQAFLVNVDDSAEKSYGAVKSSSQVYASGDLIAYNTASGDYFIANPAKTIFTFTGLPQVADVTVASYIDNDGAPATVDLLKNGVTIHSVFIAAPFGDRYAFTVDNVSLATGDTLSVKVTNVGSTLTSTILSGSLDIFFTSSLFTLRRAAYSSITGVLDNTVFNIEEMTPKRQILAHGNYLRSLLYMQPTETVLFQTGAKNVNLSTTLDGVTITENANIAVSDLGEPLFLPFTFKFRTKVPYTFSQVLAAMSAGYLQLQYFNTTLYALPIGKMISKPATNEAQEWEVLCAPRTSLASLLKLSDNTLFISNDTTMISISNLNPLHFVKYDYTKAAKYNHIEMYDDWVHNRNSRYAAQPPYLQKWQMTDTIKLQIVTAGVGQLTIIVYDKLGQEYDTMLMDIVTNSAVQLPYSLQEIEIDLADYEEGQYIFVIVANDVRVAISEWQDVKESHELTYLYEYTNTFNKQFAYFNTWGTVQIRVEGLFLPWEPDASFATFEDEPADLESLGGIAYMKRKLYVGHGTGIPDFLAQKINEVLLLNRVAIDGDYYTRQPDAKLEANFREGYPLNFYSVELRKASNDKALTLTDVGGTPAGMFASWTLDARAFGHADGVIEITVENE